MSRSLHTELDEPLRAATRALTVARGQVLDGRYVVGEELGRGAVGKVFRAYDRATRTRVALKVVHPELVGRKSALLRLGREVRHARDVQHPNVCRVFELVASQGFTFFTMELAARGPLRIGPVRRRPMADCLADARAVAAGLAAIHRAGLVHRDLKPENLLRMADGRLVLSDFGLARPAAAQRKGRAGTAGYMAPEVRRGRPASARSDVWSLGVVLHQIFFGSRDLDAEIPGPGLEAALSALCRSCMASVAARRPPDGAAVLARLEELDGELLHDRLRLDRVPAEEALAIAVQVLEALAVLHRRGQAHGAVGPANVFLRRDGTARLLRPESETPLATPAARPLDGDGTRADLAAAGHLLIECLGRRARSRRGAAGLDGLLNRVPAAVRPILYRMLGPNRMQGSAEAGGLALELAAVADTLRDRRRARRSPPGALIAEQRIASVLGVDLGAGAPDGKRQALAIRTAESFGATCARLGEYRLVAVVEGGTPLDGASAAARCALALKAALPGARFAIATGRLNAGAGAPAGEAVERALGLLGAAGGDISLDGASAALLSVRFRIADSELVGESSLIDRPRTVLGKEIPCVGRDRELATLMGLWEECAAEPVARALLVTAPAGAGKSRLLHELLDGIQSRGAPFLLLLGRGDALRAGTPFAMLGPALRAAAGLVGGEAVELQRERLLSRVQRHLSREEATRVAAFLGEMCDVHFLDGELPALRAARQDPRLMADQTQSAWLDFLEAEARACPVLLVLEDLHWGDAPSVQFVDAALRTLGQRPVMALALARPEVDDRFGTLWAERDLQRISLPPLTPRSAQRLIQLAAGDLSPERAAGMVERAAGNPFFLEELIRAVATDGRQALPETIVGTVQARFDAIGPDAKRVLRAAAIFGQTVRAEGVRELLGGDPDGSLERWLDLLVQSEILFARPVAASRELVFRHALLQEAAYDMLTAGDRALGHRRAGAFLEAHGEPEAIVLVEHYERGGEPAKAARWCRVAAQQALDATDPAEVIGRVERGLRLGAEGETLVALRRTEAQARFWRGENIAAEGAARHAMDGATGISRYLAAEELIAALGQQTRFAEVEALLEALEGASPAGDAEERVRLKCLIRGAHFLLMTGRWQPVEALLDRIERRRSALDDAGELRLVAARGQLALHRGQPAAAIDAFQRALARARALGDRRTIAEMLLNVGNGLFDLGLFEEAERTLSSALAAAERMGLTALVSCILINIASALMGLGRHTEAIRPAERSRTLARQQGNRRIEGAGEVRLTALALPTNPVRAEAHARAAVDALRMVPSVLPTAFAALARALLARGRCDEALASATEGYSMFQQLGHVEESEASVHLAYAQCLLATGDHARAQEVLAAAVRRLHERAALIDRPDWRASFLERIPEHAETLALAAEARLTPTG